MCKNSHLSYGSIGYRIGYFVQLVFISISIYNNFIAFYVYNWFCKMRDPQATDFNESWSKFLGEGLSPFFGHLHTMNYIYIYVSMSFYKSLFHSIFGDFVC